MFHSQLLQPSTWLNAEIALDSETETGTVLVVLLDLCDRHAESLNLTE